MFLVHVLLTRPLTSLHHSSVICSESLSTTTRSRGRTSSGRTGTGTTRNRTSRAAAGVSRAAAPAAAASGSDTAVGARAGRIGRTRTGRATRSCGPATAAPEIVSAGPCALRCHMEELTHVPRRRVQRVLASGVRRRRIDEPGSAPCRQGPSVEG